MTVPYQDPQTPETKASDPSAPLSAAKPPVGPGIITVVGLIFAVLVIGLGVVGVHDTLTRTGLAQGAGWIDASLSPLHRLEPTWWMAPAGFVVLIVGAWAVLTALRPRPRTAIALRAQTGVLLRPRDVAQIARRAVEDVDGVISAKVSATRRAINVAVRATTTAGLAPQVDQAVKTALSALSNQPRIRVRVTSEGGTR